MTTIDITVTKQLISKSGRLRIGHTYYTNCTSDAIVPGQKYRFEIDTTYGRILRIDPEQSTKQATIDALYKRVWQLEAILEACGINPDDPNGVYIFMGHRNDPENIELEPDLILDDDGFINDHEIDFIEREEETRIADKLNNESWIDYTSNPGMVTILLNRRNNNHEDRMNDGRDIYQAIADYCESVPIGLLPDEIKEHIPVCAL